PVAHGEAAAAGLFSIRCGRQDVYRRFVREARRRAGLGNFGTPLAHTTGRRIGGRRSTPHNARSPPADPYAAFGAWFLTAIVGQLGKLRPIVNRPWRIHNPPQAASLPHDGYSMVSERSNTTSSVDPGRSSTS